jgi:hypothetical protein
MIKAIIVLLIIFIGIRLVRATVSALLRINREYRERQGALGQTRYFVESGHVLSELDETLERNQAASLRGKHRQELLEKVMFIADLKDRIGLPARSLLHIDGVYAQGWPEEDGTAKYAAGKDKAVVDLGFVKLATGKTKVQIYRPGAWEPALEWLYAKARKVLMAIEAEDEEACNQALQEGL